MKVEVSGIRFSAAHFLIGLGKCERVHGHNWVVGVSVAGDLNERGMIIDFDVLHKILSEVCAKYDHKTLLPGKSQHLSLKLHEGSWLLESGERKYTFPERDVLVLPVENVTAEVLAQLILAEVAEELRTFPNISEVEVWVEESPGKRARACKSLRA